MDTLHVTGHSKGSSRSQSPSTTELSRDPAVVTDDAVIRSRVQSPSTVHHVVSVSNILIMSSPVVSILALSRDPMLSPGHEFNHRAPSCQSMSLNRNQLCIL